LRRLYDRILDLVFPPCCAVCGEVNTWLCAGCAQALPLIDHPICPRCGNGWDGLGVCPRCAASPLRAAPIRSTFLFQDAVREVIHALKYRGGSGVVGPLAQRMADAWHAWGLKSDLLVPVPLHAEREAQRGYNQSLLLARALAPLVGVPLAEDLLFRIRATASQTRLDRDERRENVKDAFACSDSHAIIGLSVTLIDDVATTGATLDACAVALLARGAREVTAFTLAHAL